MMEITMRQGSVQDLDSYHGNIQNLSLLTGNQQSTNRSTNSYDWRGAILLQVGKPGTKEFFSDPKAPPHYVGIQHSLHAAGELGSATGGLHSACKVCRICLASRIFASYTNVSRGWVVRLHRALR